MKLTHPMNASPSTRRSGRIWTRACLVAASLVIIPSLSLAKTTPLVMTRPLAAPATVRAVEAPPLQYADGPTISGRTGMIELADPAQVDQLCSLTLGRAWPRGSYWMGCYNVTTDAVIVPAKGAWPSEAERQALIAHEWAHARGWRHVDDGKFGRPPAARASSD